MSLGIFQSELKRDTTEVTVTNADNGIFIMVFLRPDNLEYIYSNNITSGASASSFRNSIRQVYRDVYNVVPDVTKICRDWEAFEVDCDNATANITDHVYTIVIPKSITGPSTTSIQLASLTTNSSLSQILPEEFNPPKVS